MDADQIVAALAALAQKHRLAVFRHLVQAGPAGDFPGEIAARHGIAPATLSFHLKTLQQAGLVEALASGRFIRYTANFAAMRGLVDYLTENCCGGDLSQCGPAAGCAPGGGTCAS